MGFIGPLEAWLVETAGWRHTAFFWAVTNVVVAPATLLLLRSRPEVTESERALAVAAGTEDSV